MNEKTETGPVPERAPTLYDVAREAGVSSQTVVRYMNGFTGISPKTRAKVQGAIVALGYRPNQLARMLRTSSPRRVLLFGHEIAVAGPAAIILAADEAASAAGYVLEIVTLDVHDIDATAKTIRETDPSYVAGALALAPTQAISDLFEQLPRAIPLLKEVNGDGLEGGVAQEDHDPGTRLQLDHLAQLGHRRVFIVSGPERWFSAEKRLRTALRAARDHNILVTGVARGDWTAASGHRAVHAAGLAGKPTAIVCANDEMALGALLALDELRARVPDDVSVIGYDGVRSSAYFRPPLTTVERDFDGAGRIALARLLRLMETNGRTADRRAVPAARPPLLVVRSSTGQAKD
jgi:LacI family transcriptional regulator